MTSILLGLAAGCSWGISDFLGGYKSREMPLATILLVSQPVGLIIAMIAVVAQVTAPPSWQFLAFGLIGGIANVIGLAALYRAMAIGEISLVAPVAAMSPALAVLAGLVVGERPSILQGAGMAVAVLGVILISLRQGEGPRRQSAGALPLAALAAVGFGITFVAVHRASQGNLLWGILFQRIGMVSAVVLWAISARQGPTASWKAALPVLVTVGILDLSGTTLFGLASVIGLVGLAAVLASLHPVSTIIMARIVAHEKLNQIQRAGIGATLLGVALISAGG